MSNKPYIAKDTKEPLVVMGGYEVNEHGGIIKRPIPQRKKGEDYGFDPLGNGKYKMVPSGDVVDAAERDKRLRQG